MDFKRFLSVIVALAMMVTLLIPVAVSSEETDAVPEAAEVVELSNDASEEPEEPEVTQDNNVEEPADKTLVDEAPVDETPADEVPLDEPPAKETPADETPAKETPADEIPADETPVDETPVKETPADETPVDETPVDEIPTKETPVDETPAEEIPAEEDETVDTEVLDDDSVTENTDSEDDEEEEVPFTQGYVRVNGGTIVYAAESKQEEKGFFFGDAVVYAILSAGEANEAYSWLRIVFDTAEAREADEALLNGYVQFKDVTVLSAEAVEQLIESLNNDYTARSYNEKLLPMVYFTPKTEENTEETAEELVEEDVVVQSGRSVDVIATAEKTSVQIGETVHITAVVGNTSGTLTYQWFKSNDGGNKWSTTTLTGNNTAELSFVATVARLGYQYRCAVTDANGTWYSNAVQVTLLNVVEPEITAVAEKASVKVGETVKMTVTAKDTSGTLTYQWFKSNDGGNKWSTTTLTGNNTAELTFVATAARLGYQYRCAVTDANGTWYSNAVQVTLNLTEPEITAVAEKESVRVGEMVKMTVTAKNTSGTLSYQWFKSNDGGSKWSTTTLTGNNTSELTFVATVARLGYQYRCKVTDANGTWYSNAVKVALFGAEPEITAVAEKANVKVGETVKMTVTAKNTSGSLTYQWFKSNDGGSKWSTTTLTGNNTAELTFVATAARLGYQYRCAVTDVNGTWYSNAVQVTLNLTEPEITAVAEKESVRVGEMVKMTVTAKNTSGTLSYQWFKSNDGGSKWSTTTLSGYKTAELSFAATEARLGYQYRCAVTDANGTWYSNAVQVTLLNVVEPEITAVAEKASVKIGETVKMTVTAKDTNGTLTYQWFKSNDGGNKWSTTTLTGNKTAELTFVATEARLGYQYRCAVTDANGTWYSNAVEVALERFIVIDDVAYEAITDTTCRVVSYSGSMSSLVIPTKVEGMTVTEIGEEAFMGNTTLTSISLPNTITVIRARAFKNCVNLSSMTTH